MVPERAVSCRDVKHASQLASVSAPTPCAKVAMAWRQRSIFYQLDGEGHDRWKG